MVTVDRAIGGIVGQICAMLVTARVGITGAVEHYITVSKEIVTRARTRVLLKGGTIGAGRSANQ